MKKITFFTLIVLFVIVIYFNNYYKKQEFKNNRYDNINETKKIDVNQSSVQNKHPKSSKLNFLKEIKKFNETVNIDLNRNDLNSKYFEVDKLYDNNRKDTTDIEKQIHFYINDIEKYQIQVESLSKKCIKLNERLAEQSKILNSGRELQEGFYNQHFFDKGLFNTGFCENIGTKKDVFWEFVEIARRGNKIAQLLLFDRVFDAVSNGNVSILSAKKRPIEYMELRNEAINYLRVLSHQGVYKASLNLSRIYSKNNWSLIPNNSVLSYFYSYIADKQSGFEISPYENNLEIIYSNLTKKEKDMADRMIESYKR